jgi:hypothetical protein
MALMKVRLDRRCLTFEHAMQLVRRGTAMTSASIRIITVPALTAALSVLAAYASATNTKAYLVEYQAYTAALASGDNETAEIHGLAAWKAAEESLGDHRLTGILAFNYGRLIIFKATEKAAVPLRRASELQQTGLVELPQGALRLYLSYAEFAASGFDEGPAEELRETLDAVGLREGSLIRDIAPMWLQLTVRDLDARDYRKAERSAAKAEAAITKADPNASRELAEVILLGAVASLGRAPWKIDNLEAAIEQFDRARRLFPPQKDLDSFDPLLAQVMAWQRASRRTLREEMGWAPPYSEEDDLPPAPPIFQYQADDSLECGDLEWEEQASPRYPAGAWHHRYRGIVVLGYRLGDDLRVHGGRVLAEIPPREQFGTASLAALSGWRVKSLPTGGSGCSYVRLFNFDFEYRVWHRTPWPSITSSTP